MNGDLKQTFVLKSVQQYFDNVEAAMHLFIARSKMTDTGALKQSIKSHTSLSGGGVSGKLQFHEYGRFQDMGVGRGHPLGGLKSTRISLQASNTVGEAMIRDRTRKPKKFYSPIAYGNLGWLMGKLLHGYSDEVIEMLKREMTNGNSGTATTS